MAAYRETNADWVRANQLRYFSATAPNEATDAVQHVLAARAALEVGEYKVAEFMYLGAEKLWRKMEILQPGKWGMEIENTSRELKSLRSASH